MIDEVTHEVSRMGVRENSTGRKPLAEIDVLDWIVREGYAGSMEEARRLIRELVMGSGAESGDVDTYGDRSFGRPSSESENEWSSASFHSRKAQGSQQSLASRRNRDFKVEGLGDGSDDIRGEMDSHGSMDSTRRRMKNPVAAMTPRLSLFGKSKKNEGNDSGGTAMPHAGHREGLASPRARIKSPRGKDARSSRSLASSCRDARSSRGLSSNMW